MLKERPWTTLVQIRQRRQLGQPGQLRPVCRQNNNQRTLFNGHKLIHAIKFQSVVAPNGLIVNLHGPVEG